MNRRPSIWQILREVNWGWLLLACVFWPILILLALWGEWLEARPDPKLQAEFDGWDAVSDEALIGFENVLHDNTFDTPSAAGTYNG